MRANDLTHNAVSLGKKSRLSRPILRVAKVAHADASQAKPLVWSEAMQLRIVHRHCRAIKPIGWLLRSAAVNAAGSEISNSRSHRDRGQGIRVNYQILAVCE
jgi:hypothetical protein